MVTSKNGLHTVSISRANKATTHTMCSNFASKPAPTETLAKKIALLHFHKTSTLFITKDCQQKKTKPHARAYLAETGTMAKRNEAISKSMRPNLT